MNLASPSRKWPEPTDGCRLYKARRTVNQVIFPELQRQSRTSPDGADFDLLLSSHSRYLRYAPHGVPTSTQSAARDRGMPNGWLRQVD